MSGAQTMVTHDGELPSPHAEQLAREIDALRDAAVKSQDPLLVAKAVAISDKNVQDLIRHRLHGGEQLVEISLLTGCTGPEAQVFFRLLPACGEAVPATDSGVLAFVDLAQGEVIGIVDPFVLPSESRIGRPFVTIGELDPGSFAPGDHQAMNLLVDREREFFTDLGLGHLVTRGSDNPAGSRSTVSITYSPVGPGGRSVEDDTLPEGAYDHL